MAPRPTAYSKGNIKSNVGAALNIEGAVQEAIRKGSKEFSKDAQKWVKHAKKQNGSLEKKISESNRSIVAKSRAQMVAQYTAQRKLGGLRDYRSADQGKNRRYGGGAMLRAIKSDAMIMTDGVSIRLFDFGALERQAPQWYRLNFGSGKRPRSSAALLGEIRLNVGGERIFLGRGITFDGWRAGEPNILPRGFFAGLRFSTSGAAHGALSSGKPMRAGSAFYLGVPGYKGRKRVKYNAVKRLPTKPTRAYGYLEVGVKVVNQEFAKNTSALMREMKKSFETRGVKRVRAK